MQLYYFERQYKGLKVPHGQLFTRPNSSIRGGGQLMSGNELLDGH